MDVSLDDYISTSNFKVKIGNPGFKGNSRPSGNAPGGFQQGKKKFGNVKFGNKASNVSVTVPAVPKTNVKVNVTNQVRDARDRLVSKQNIQDARQKISVKAPTDARQKLHAMRANKGPNAGVVDARAKIQAKKQLSAPGPKQQNVQDFTLTRTVSNSANNVQISGGGTGNIHITKTLTKVMPPGYEALVGNSPSATPSVAHGPPTSVTLQRGPANVRTRNISNIIRTVPNTSAQQIRPPFHPVQPQPGQPLPQYPSHAPPILPHQPQPSHAHTMVHMEGHPRPPRLHAPVPHPFQPPPASRTYVVPQQVHPAPHVIPPQNQPPPPAEIPFKGPPYPVEDPVLSVTPRVPQHMSGPLPRIQVQNDQYRPPAPPYPQYSAPPHAAPAPTTGAHQPQYSYYPSTAPQQSYYPDEPPIHRMTTRQSEPVIQRTTTRQSEPVIQRTTQQTESPIQRTTHQVVKTTPSRDYAEESYGRSSGLKRKSSELGGPLKLSSTNTIPVLVDVGSRSAPTERSKERSYAPIEPPQKKLKDEGEVISPLQGYRVLITNLHLNVTQDDVIELFGAIGAVKKAKILKPGSAEVVYVTQKNARAAVDIYHERNLDGQPMTVKMATPESARIKEPPETLPPSVRPEATGPLKLSKKPAGMAKVSSDKKSVEVDVLHKALFKSGSTPSKPVTFTVNI